MLGLVSPRLREQLPQ